MPIPQLIQRPRRLRRNPAIRRMVRETRLAPENLVLPLFIVPGQGIHKPVQSMPGVAQLSIDEALPIAKEAYDLGLGGIILFGIPKVKDSTGSDAYDQDGIVQHAIREIKRFLPELYVIADTCLCEYTDHAHCGVIRANEVDNDATLELLGRAVVSYAEAGVDMVAPSGMMDGMVAAIRRSLDGAGYVSIPILSYAVKYASAYYGPFRDAAENTPSFGDRRSYQMDPANRREALREAALDVAEGADMLMVKPGLAYMDILRELRDHFDLPLAIYNVSGEYAMVKAAAANGWIDEARVVMETLLGFRRAGADLILTYHALEAARWMVAK
ncbi:MAG: porphobilinogen synthase [Magnetococcales bacterium]|nr:porphobilinogen synthase [Magnetococcales bacterium]MBF0439423.1 porphobilinogen synthase [Magnetococcales bacterium]